MARDPFAVLDEDKDDALPALDVSQFKRHRSPQESEKPARAKTHSASAPKRPTSAEIARLAAEQGFTPRDGASKIDGRTLRRSGRTQLLAVRITPDCKQLIDEIVEGRGKQYKTGQLIGEMFEAWIREQNDQELLERTEELDLCGKSRA